MENSVQIPKKPNTSWTEDEKEVHNEIIKIYKRSGITGFKDESKTENHLSAIKKLFNKLQADYSKKDITDSMREACNYIKAENVRSLVAGYYKANKKDKIEYHNSICNVLEKIVNGNFGNLEICKSNKVIVWMFRKIIGRIFSTKEKTQIMSCSSIISSQKENEELIKNEIRAINKVMSYIKNENKNIKDKEIILNLLHDLQYDRINDLVLWRIKYLSATYTEKINSSIDTKEHLKNELQNCAQNGERVNFETFVDYNKSLKNKKNKIVYEKFEKLSVLGKKIEDILENCKNIKHEVVTKNIAIMISDIEGINNENKNLNERIKEFEDEYTKELTSLEDFIKKEAAGFIRDDEKLLCQYNDLISYSKKIINQIEFEEIKTEKEQITSKILISNIKKNGINNINEKIYNKLNANKDISNINIDILIKEEADKLQKENISETMSLSANSSELLEQVRKIIEKIEGKSLNDNKNERKDNISENNQMYGNRNHFIENIVEHEQKKPRENARDNNVNHVRENNSENDKITKEQQLLFKWSNKSDKDKWKDIKEKFNDKVNEDEFDIKVLFKDDDNLFNSIESLIAFNKNQSVYSYIIRKNLFFSGKFIKFKILIGKYLSNQNSWNKLHKKQMVFNKYLEHINSELGKKIELSEFEEIGNVNLYKDTKEFINKKLDHEDKKIIKIKNKIKEKINKNKIIEEYKKNKKVVFNDIINKSIAHSDFLSTSSRQIDNLGANEIINKLNKERSELKNDYKKLNANYALKKEQVSKFEKEIDDDNKLIRKMEDDLKSLNYEHVKFKEKIESIEKKYNETNLEKEKIKKESNIYSLKNLEMNSEIDRLRKQLKEKKLNINEKEKEIEQYVNQIDEYKNQLAILSQQKTNLEANASKLKENTAKKEKLEKEKNNLLEKIENLTKKLNEANAQITSKDQYIQDYNNSFVSLRRENKNLQSEKKQSDEQIESLIEEKKVILKEKLIMKNKYNDLLEEQDKVSKVYIEQTENNAKTITKLHQEIEDVKNKLEIKEKELNEAIASNTQLKENITQKEELSKSDKNNLLEQMSILEEDLRDKSKKINEINEENKQAMTNAKEKINELEKTIKSNIDKLNSLESKLGELEEKLKNKTDEISKINKEKNELEEKIKQQEKEYYFLKEALEGEINELKSNLSTKENDLKEVQDELLSLKENHAILKNNYESEISVKKQLEDENIEKINKYKTQLKQKEEAIILLNKKLSESENSINEKQIQIDSLNKEAQKKENAFKKLDTKANSQSNKIKELNNLIKEKESTLKNLESNHEKLKKEMIKIKEQKFKLTQNIEIQKIAYQNLQEKLNNPEIQIDNFDGNNELKNNDEEMDNDFYLVNELNNKIENIFSDNSNNEKEKKAKRIISLIINDNFKGEKIRKLLENNIEMKPFKSKNKDFMSFLEKQNKINENKPILSSPDMVLEVFKNLIPKVKNDSIDKMNDILNKVERNIIDSEGAVEKIITMSNEKEYDNVNFQPLKENLNKVYQKYCNVKMLSPDDKISIEDLTKLTLLRLFQIVFTKPVSGNISKKEVENLFHWLNLYLIFDKKINKTINNKGESMNLYESFKNVSFDIINNSSDYSNYDLINLKKSFLNRLIDIYQPYNNDYNPLNLLQSTGLQRLKDLRDVFNNVVKKES